ncbi:hypothetical protein GM661_04655 [Iocasia frigidifontis]|uniref:Uncharacterized protein n=1 Tax=Iocasia fonsfrigidae TaxID=2682810 RepID=A0A8A7KGP4_9FIRM|nr:hypothetical protein [Iocasia fonsfrigidae]QTL97324.1 hypothetical protein GM661_04655 [Iocasia fonsfrigidae]
MTQTDKSKQKQVIIIAVIVLIAPVIIGLLVNLGGHDIEDVRTKMEEYLYEKYGEEFVVDRIGTRSGRNDKKFYQARIYPKSIVGTSKEGDDFYYASASVSIEGYGRLGGVGDSYSFVTRNIDMEKYLLSSVKKIFGERVLLKVDVEHKVTGDGSWWAGYKSTSLEEMRNKIKDSPEKNRIELKLFIYIFDRIETEEEKEERRREIFEFVQYLKEEGLYKYLELGVIFIDERVLAPGYGEYSLAVRFSDKEKVEIGGKKVYLPPLELRKEMSVKLEEEIDKMSEEELLERMGRIKKSRLDDLRGYNTQCGTFIYSWGMLEENYSSSLSRRDKSRNYSKLEHVELDNGLKYMYLSRKE